jgi:hypothetical protein
MGRRWKFWSDTNESTFVLDLDRANVRFRHDVKAHVVEVIDDAPWTSDLATDLGATPCN